ncbi:MAG: tyrosine-type recombinase/integrase [Phycisphaerae bacterium]
MPPSHCRNIAERANTMEPIKFTDADVKKIKAPAQGQTVRYDSLVPGLMLFTSYGGAKTWRVLYYVNGKPRSKKLGRFPDVRVKMVREAARTFLDDPQAALARGKVGTFQEVAGNFIKRHVEKKGLRSQPEIERCLNKYIYPRWKDQPFLEIKRHDVATLLDHIEDNHGPRQADMVLAIISKLTRWHQARSDDYVSPVVPGMRRTDAKERERKRILSDEELKAVWEECGDMGTFGSLVKVALLTAQRRGKVVTMKWDDVVDGEWHIPSEPREKSHAGTLKLPQTVLGIIETRPRVAENPYVFPGRGKKHLNAWSQGKAELDKKLPKEMAHWTLHDLRRTARSLMSRAGVRPDIAERVLGHVIAGVEGVYDRHSYADEKADALNRLASLVETIINPPSDNVVPLLR